MMFDYQSEPRGFSPALFLVQLFAAPLGSLICGGLATELVQEMLRAKHGNLFGYLLYSGFGFVIGYKMQVSFPRAIESGGRWIWIPPVCLATFSVVHYSSVFHRSMLPDYLWPTPGPDLKGIELLVVTLPAIGSCFYSIGAILASRTDQTSWQRFLRTILARP
jgi:hypothetical protein